MFGAAALFSFALFVVLHLSSTSALAAGAGPMSAEERQQAFEDLITRLELTEEQEPTVRSILEQDRANRLAILEENGVDLDSGRAPSPRVMMGMLPAMTNLNEQTEGALAPVLTPDQMETYETVVRERRLAMRSRMRQR